MLADKFLSLEKNSTREMYGGYNSTYLELQGCNAVLGLTRFKRIFEVIST